MGKCEACEEVVVELMKALSFYENPLLYFTTTKLVPPGKYVNGVAKVHGAMGVVERSVPHCSVLLAQDGGRTARHALLHVRTLREYGKK